MSAFASAAFSTAAFSISAFSFDSSLATVSTPSTLGNAGGTDWRDWRWYEGQDLRPNWYIYAEVKKLKKEIVRATRDRKKLEKRIFVAKKADELERLVAEVNTIKEKIAALIRSREAMLRSFAEEEEEAEFMELMSDIL